MDTISHEGFSKTKINKPAPRKTEELTEEEKEKMMKAFVTRNEKDLKVSLHFIPFVASVLIINRLQGHLELILCGH